MVEPGSQIEFIACPPITQDQLHSYSLASGDYNRIHLDEEVAKSVGLPGVIAHGMLIAAFISERASQYVNSRNPRPTGFELSQFQTRFKAMTFLGDVLSIGGAVKESDSEKLTLELQAKNQRGEIITTATARWTRTLSS